MCDRAQPTLARRAPAWRIRVARLACAATLAACSGAPAAFGPSFRDNQLSEVQDVVHRVEAAKPRVASSIAIGASPGQLYAYDLESRRVLWQHALNASSAPQLAGECALVQVGNSVVGYALRSGERRFEIGAGEMSLQGADGEGASSVFTLSLGQGTLARAEVVAVHAGSVRWRRAIQGQGGVPALAGEIVLVPWSTQFLSALDFDDGREIARLRVRDGVISHAVRSPTATFIGSFHGLARLSAAITSGSLKRGGEFTLPQHELPGRPVLLPDVHAQTHSVRLDSAEHRIGLAFTPAAGRKGVIELQDDVLYLFFYRFVYALDPRQATIRWVRVLDADIVGARASSHGVAVGDEHGRLSFLAAASGETRWQAETGIGSTVLRLPDAGFGHPTAGQPPAAAGLRAQLVAAIQDTDARLAPAREFAVQQLALLPQPEVTGDLVTLCDSDALTVLVREQACLELEHRPNGSDAILGALARHAGHLEGTTAPQVGALATAAASLKLTAAVPHLIAHLADPATRSGDLAPLITALADLGDPAAIPGLAGFLALYHADPIDAALVGALQLIPGALVKLHGSAMRPVLSSVASDELGVYSVRQQARTAGDALAQPPPEPAPTPAATPDPAEATTGEETAGPSAALGDDAIPARLTPELVEAALQPVQQQLQECLTQASPATLQARIVMVVSDGHAQTVSVLPAQAQACIEPLVRAQPFPATTARTPERLSYTLKR